MDDLVLFSPGLCKQISFSWAEIFEDASMFFYTGCMPLWGQHPTGTLLASAHLKDAFRCDTPDDTKSLFLKKGVEMIVGRSGMAGYARLQSNTLPDCFIDMAVSTDSKAGVLIMPTTMVYKSSSLNLDYLCFSSARPAIEETYQEPTTGFLEKLRQCWNILRSR